VLVVGALALSACTAPSSPSPSLAPRVSAPSPVASVAPPPPPLATDGRPRNATLTIPALGLRDFPVTAYRGTPDDAPGTAIQDDGALAAPYGSGGLVGPGGIGNHLITGHRSSSTAPFAQLPSLRHGARVVLTTRTHRLVYEVVRDQRTSFRSRASLRAQSAAVPGRPGVEPTRAMLTLSTCATAEDHAAGNYWADEFHNPEHRLEKIAVLRSVSAR
jgi:sortase A